MLFREDCLVLRDFCLWLLTIEREDFEGVMGRCCGGFVVAGDNKVMFRHNGLNGHIGPGEGEIGLG